MAGVVHDRCQLAMVLLSCPPPPALLTSSFSRLLSLFAPPLAQQTAAYRTAEATTVSHKVLSSVLSR